MATIAITTGEPRDEEEICGNVSGAVTVFVEGGAQYGIANVIIIFVD